MDNPPASGPFPALPGRPQLAGPPAAYLLRAQEPGQADGPNPATRPPSHVTAAAQSPRRTYPVLLGRFGPPAERDSKRVRTVARYGEREDLISWSQ